MSNSFQHLALLKDAGTSNEVINTDCGIATDATPFVNNDIDNSLRAGDKMIVCTNADSVGSKKGCSIIANASNNITSKATMDT